MGQMARLEPQALWGIENFYCKWSMLKVTWAQKKEAKPCEQTRFWRNSSGQPWREPHETALTEPENSINECVKGQVNSWEINSWKNQFTGDWYTVITQKAAQRERERENRLRFSHMENRTNWPNILHVIGTPKGEGRQRMASDTVKAIYYFLLWMKVKIST